MTYFVLTRAKAAAHNLLIPTSQIAPSPVKSHQGMKQQQPLLWGMKAIELSFWSLMEQEGYCSGNGCGWAICHQPVLECVGGERKVTSTAAVCFTNDAHLLSLFTRVFVRFNCGTYICSPRLSFIARILHATIFYLITKAEQCLCTICEKRQEYYRIDSVANCLWISSVEIA